MKIRLKFSSERIFQKFEAKKIFEIDRMYKSRNGWNKNSQKLLKPVFRNEIFSLIRFFYLKNWSFGKNAKIYKSTARAVVETKNFFFENRWNLFLDTNSPNCWGYCSFETKFIGNFFLKLDNYCTSWSLIRNIRRPHINN